MGDWVTVRLNDAETGRNKFLVRTRIVIVKILVSGVWVQGARLYKNRAYGVYKV